MERGDVMADSKRQAVAREESRLQETRAGKADWKEWGPYLAERAWGTVREDYSANGDVWGYFPHDHARSRVYRWNEDGLAGISDDEQRLCFALALWNGQDAILKERLFGLTGSEGNHGEDVKEYYFYLDSTPTHSYVKMLYKYPQWAFPYADLVETNRKRNKQELEYELFDTGVFAENRYFDVFVEYAKADTDDILIRITAFNRGPEAADLHILPTLWFRNTWSWGWEHDKLPRPVLTEIASENNVKRLEANHATLGEYLFACEDADMLLFTENETNTERLFGSPNATPYVKDAFHEYVIHGRKEAVNLEGVGTKTVALYQRTVAAGGSLSIRLRLSKAQQFEPAKAHVELNRSDPFASFDEIFAQRQSEADAFYGDLQPPSLTDEERSIQRQAFAGMLCTKQFYHYNIEEWLGGDPAQPAPPAGRKKGRNYEWRHLNAGDIISMPDKWEYPWFAAWDLAFHCIPLALLDSDFAKQQLLLLGREWYQHPNGQVPAYEWSFSDVNPPVLAWATWRVYKIDQKEHDKGDLAFLERMFHKLMLNFTWWVNRKDAEGLNVFQGGFLGLDNIGVFDRSKPLPTGGRLEQSDGTSWMGMFCLNMLTISLELAVHNSAYEDIALKFFEHFLFIAEAMNNIAGEGISLWNEEDEFFYDVLHLENDENIPLKLRSMVGLIPLFAVTTIEPSLLEKVPQFKHHLEWFLEHRPDLAKLVSRWYEPKMGDRRLLAILRGHRMKRVLYRMLDESEFLSAYGVRALSRIYAEHPYTLHVDGSTYSVAYVPADSDSGLFGGNSNWRGPIWFPVNYLIIEALQQFHHYYSDDFLVECPTHSAKKITLNQIADEISGRMINIFLRDANGRRAVFGDNEVFQNDPHWRDYIPFHEYFHGDNGAGIGASHQTGWTGLVAKLIQQQGEKHKESKVS
jgi:Mannosylglycerate hydrolase MGH1-like glycoside hydrolase domain